MERPYCCFIETGGSATCRDSLPQRQQPPHRVFLLGGHEDWPSVPGHWMRQNRHWTYGSVSDIHCPVPSLALLLDARKTRVRPEF